MCESDGTEFIDTSSRRSMIERRQFTYSFHIPERRSGFDRRNSFGRRAGGQNRRGFERRSSLSI